MRLQGAEVKKMEDTRVLKVNGSEKPRVWKRGEKACARRLEQVEKSVRCDV